MWRSRLRATFLSNRDDVNAGYEPAITHKTGYDIYRLLGTGFYHVLYSSFSILPQCCLVTASEREGLEGSLAKFGFSVGFVRFANVPESEGMVCVGTILLFFLFVFQFF